MIGSEAAILAALEAFQWIITGTVIGMIIPVARATNNLLIILSIVTTTSIIG